MRRRLAEGFTLMEILVVLAVIAILATIAIANYVTGRTHPARSTSSNATSCTRTAASSRTRVSEGRRQKAEGTSPRKILSRSGPADAPPGS